MASRTDRAGLSRSRPTNGRTRGEEGLPRRRRTPATARRKSPTPFVQLLHGALEEAARLLEADGAMAYLLEPDGRTLRFADEGGIADVASRRWVRRLRLTVGEGMFGVAVAERRVVATDNYPEDRSFTHSADPDRFVHEIGLRSMVVAPLVAGERVFGALGTFSRRSGAFTDAQIRLVRALADHAAAAMANAILIEELAGSRSEIARRADTERTLREVAARLTAVRDPGELLQLVIDSSTRLLGANGGMIDLIGLRGPGLALAAVTDPQLGADGPLRAEVEVEPDAGVSGLAVATRTVQWTGAYLADDRFRHSPERDRFIREAGIRSVVAAPLLIADEPVGAITLYSTVPDAFDEHSAVTLKALADQAAVTIATAQLIEQLERAREEVQRRAEAERGLRQIAANISAIRDPDHVLQQAVNEAARLLRADGAIIDLLDEEAGLLRWGYDTGMFREADHDEVRSATVALGEGISGRAVAERRVLRTADYRSHEFDHTEATDAFVERFGIRSVIVAPIVGEAGPVGAIEVHARRPDAFDDLDAAILGGLADQAAIAIQNARLIEALNRSRDEIRRRADAETALRRINAGLSAIREPDVILQQTVDEAKRLLDSDAARIDLLEDGHLVWTYASGDPGIASRQHADYGVIPVGTGVAGTAVARGAPFRTADYLADDGFAHHRHVDDYIRRHGVRSVLAVPLVGESGALGALTVSSAQPDFYADAHAELLQALADQAAIAIQNARLIEQLERSREEIRRRAEAEEALRRIAADISALRDPEAILQQTVDEAKRLLASRDARIDLLDAGRLVWTYSSGQTDVATAGDSSFPVGEGVAGAAVTSRRPFLTGDYAGDDRFVHTAAADAFVRDSGVRSVLAVPMLGEMGALGALSVASDRRDAYGQGDAELLQALADQAAIAIQNARLIEVLERSQADLARRADTERSLREIAARIADLRDPQALLREVVEETRRLLGSDGAHLTRMSEDRSHVVPVVVAGGMDEATAAWLKTQQFPIDGGINGLAAGRGEPIWTEDYHRDDRIPLEPDDVATAERLGLRGMAAVPLRAPQGEVIGTLAVSFRAPHRFDAEEIGLLQGLADHAAIAVANTHLYERLRRSESRYRHLVQNSPDLVWSIGPDGRFSFVSDTCERLTGWKPEELLGRSFGAVVHDLSSDVAQLDWMERMSHGSQELRGRLYLLHRDGHPIPAEFIAIGTLDADGGFLGANGSVRDMTDLDRLERELRASEERYRTLLQSSPDLIWAADPEGRYTFVSDRVENLLGRTPEEIVGHHFAEFIAPSMLDVANAGYAELLANPTASQRLRFSLVHADGREIPYEVGALGLADADGRLVAVHGVARDVSEQDRLERELRESEARFRQLVQTIPDVIWRCDRDGYFRFIADRAEALFGWPAAEIVGRHFSFLTMDESMPEARENWDRLMRAPDVVQRVRYTLRRADGTTFPAEITAIGVTENGEFLGGHGTVRDISERERLERELRDSEERLRFLVDNSPDVIFSIDEDGRYAYVSESIERVTAFRPDELVGRPFAGIVPATHLERLRELWASHQADPRTEQKVRIELPHRDGRLVPVEVSTVGIVRDGAFAGIQGVARDVTDRERLERELRASEERYRFLVQNSPDIVFAASADGTLTYLSETIERLTGWRPEEMIGRHFRELVQRNTAEDAGSRWDAFAANPGQPLVVALDLRHRNGSSIPFEINAVAIVDTTGRFAGVHGSARDVSDREALEHDLRRQAAELAAGEERSHLARELHDSVTQALFSMTLLSRTIEMLVDRDAAAARAKLADLRELQREALAEMRALIFELRPGNLEQDGLIHALKTHTAALQGRIGLPIVVKSELDGRLAIEVEEGLYRIAQEALHNVVKHAGARQVRLELSRVDGDVRLVIEDDGKGFDPAAVQTGHLGLAGMRARADRIGGRLAVRSGARGGTTVEVVVPADRLAAPAGAVGSAE